MKRTCKSAVQTGGQPPFGRERINGQFTVTGLERPERLDVYCSKKMPELTRSRLKTGLRSVRINSAQAKISRRVHNGDKIELEWEDPVPHYAAPQNIPLDIIYENENIIAVNKSAGTVTHPANGNWDGTLVNALNYYRLFVSPVKDEFSAVLKKYEALRAQGEEIPKDKNADVFRQGIVHRLDKDTSGVIITARNSKTEQFLKAEFKKRNVKKYYLAVLNGVPKKKCGKIKTAVFRSKGNRKKFSASADVSKGKTAVSQYRILKSDGKYSFAVFRIFTGRTHQIRLHAKFIGCPILGDLVYGKKNAGFPDSGLMLHAYKLLIDLDGNGSLQEFKAPLPKKFKAVLRRIGP